jgi:hypothetical protein
MPGILACRVVNPLLIVVTMRNGLSLLLLCLLAAASSAAEGVIPREHHPWAAFRPGSWKVVQVTSDTLDESGQVIKTSVAETKTTLLAVHESSYELLVETTVDVGGKKFSPEPVILQQGMFGETVGQTLTVRSLPNTRCRLDQQEIPVRATQIEIQEKDQRRVMVLNHSDTCQPHLLQRQTDVYDAQGHLLSQTTSTTHDLNANSTVLGKRCSTWQRRTEQKHTQGSMLLVEKHCSEVPGGVIEHTSEEKDANGKLTRRSTLKLTSYSVATTNDTTVRRRASPRRSRRENKNELPE